MKRSFVFFSLLVAVILAGAGPAFSGVTESFNDTTVGSYSQWYYHGFHAMNSMCHSDHACAGNSVRLRNASPPVPFLEYWGADTLGKDGGVGTISFNYRCWSAVTVDDVLVNINGAGWTYLLPQINTTNIVCTQWSYNLNNSSDNIIVRVQRVSGDRLLIDDFSITDYGAADTTRPTIASASAISATQVDVLFSENVDQTTAETASNYSIDGGIGNPSLAVRDATNNSLVHLTVSTLTGYITYTLTVNNVKDLAGNTILPNSQKTFVYIAEIGNIIITEFMANPNAVADNNGEWFEVYNNTGSQINMNGWILKDNGGADTVDANAYIASHDYFVFCVNETLAVNGGVPTDYAYHYGTSGWGLAFNNSGTDRIVIWDNIGQLQDSVPYDYTAWGITAGASHQLRNLTDDNTVAANWCVAQNMWPGSAGDKGTPGGMNGCGDATKPTIVSAVAQSATLVNVLFSELVTVATCEVEGNYNITPTIGNPSLAVRDGGNPALVHLTVSTLTEDLTYTLTVNNVADSVGNAILPNSTVQFSYHDYAGDIVITEIMPNPYVVFDQNGEWFEIYNATNSSINLNGWMIHDNAGSDIVNGDSTIAAHDYFVFCVNDTLATNGGVPTDYNYIYGYGPTGLALSNTADVLYILTPQGVPIDCVRYTTAWPWGNGSSMQLKDVTLNNDDVNNWCTSQNAWLGSAGDKGTPGQACDCAAPPDTVALTICQARLQDACGVPVYLDTLIRVHGIVSFADTCMRTAFLQAGGCGIALYGWPVSTIFPPPANRMMRPGDSVVVTGYLTQYAGLAEIASAFGYTPQVVLLDSNRAVVVTDLDCSLISYAADAGDDSCSGEAYESEKIQVDAIDFIATGTFSPGDMNYLAKCASGDTIEVRIDSCSAFLDTAIPDEPMNVIGILSQYDWTVCYCHHYQIIPTELIPAGPPPDPPRFLTLYRYDTEVSQGVMLRWLPAETGPEPAGYMVYAGVYGDPEPMSPQGFVPYQGGGNLMFWKATADLQAVGRATSMDVVAVAHPFPTVPIDSVIFRLFPPLPDTVYVNRSDFVCFENQLSVTVNGKLNAGFSSPWACGNTDFFLLAYSGSPPYPIVFWEVDYNAALGSYNYTITFDNLPTTPTLVITVR